MSKPLQIQRLLYGQEIRVEQETAQDFSVCHYGPQGDLWWCLGSGRTQRDALDDAADTLDVLRGVVAERRCALRTGRVVPSDG